MFVKRNNDNKNQKEMKRYNESVKQNNSRFNGSCCYILSQISNSLYFNILITVCYYNEP